MTVAIRDIPPAVSDSLPTDLLEARHHHSGIPLLNDHAKAFVPGPPISHAVPFSLGPRDGVPLQGKEVHVEKEKRERCAANFFLGVECENVKETRPVDVRV